MAPGAATIDVEFPAPCQSPSSHANGSSGALRSAGRCVPPHPANTSAAATVIGAVRDIRRHYTKSRSTLAAIARARSSRSWPELELQPLTYRANPSARAAGSRDVLALGPPDLR